MKRPKTKLILGVFSIIVLAVALKVATLWETPERQTIRIEVTGTEGRVVESRIDADGKEQTHKGKIPTEIIVDGHRVSWEVKRIDGPEREKFKVAIHTPEDRYGGGSAENYRVLRGGLVGPSGLRRSRAWHGRFDE
jgi:hypothetical protein